VGTPIGFQKMKLKDRVVDIPIFAVDDGDILNKSMRVKLPEAVGCYSLIEPSALTPIRVMTKSGVKGIDLQFSDTTPADEVINLQQVNRTATSISIGWANPEGENSTDFSYCNVYRGESLIAANIVDEWYNDTGLQPGTSYTYRVTTVDSSDNESTGVTITIVTESSAEFSVDWENGSPSSTNTAFVEVVEKTSDYVHLKTVGNSRGYDFPILNISDPTKTYTVTAEVEILSGVDDVITLHIWNMTQNIYQTQQVATSQYLTGQKQTLTGQFWITANYNAGDVLTVRPAQMWVNGTHDSPYYWKVYKTNLSVSGQ
jgi:hypothetical protein